MTTDVAVVPPTVYTSSNRISSDDENDDNYDENNHWIKPISPSGLTTDMLEMSPGSKRSADDTTGSDDSPNTSAKRSRSKEKRNFGHIFPSDSRVGTPTQIQLPTGTATETVHRTYKYDWPTWKSDASLLGAWVDVRHRSKDAARIDKNNRFEVINVTSMVGGRVNINETNLDEYLDRLARDYIDRNGGHCMQETAPIPSLPKQINSDSLQPITLDPSSVHFPKVFIDLDEAGVPGGIWTNPETGDINTELLDLLIGRLIEHMISSFFPKLQAEQSKVCAIVTVSRQVCIDRLVEREPRTYYSGVHIVFPELFVRRERQLVIRSTLQVFLHKLTNATKMVYDWSKVLDKLCSGLRTPGALKAERCKRCTAKTCLTCDWCVFGKHIKSMGVYMYYKEFNWKGKVTVKYPEAMTLERVVDLMRMTTLAVGSPVETPEFVMYEFASVPEQKKQQIRTSSDKVYMDPSVHADLYENIRKAISQNDRHVWRDLKVEAVFGIMPKQFMDKVIYEGYIVDVSGTGQLICASKAYMCVKNNTKAIAHESNRIYFKFFPWLMEQHCYDEQCKEYRKNCLKGLSARKSIGFRMRQQIRADACKGFFKLDDTTNRLIFPHNDAIMYSKMEKHSKKESSSPLGFFENNGLVGLSQRDAMVRRTLSSKPK